LQEYLVKRWGKVPREIGEKTLIGLKQQASKKVNGNAAVPPSGKSLRRVTIPREEVLEFTKG